MPCTIALSRLCRLSSFLKMYTGPVMSASVRPSIGSGTTGGPSFRRLDSALDNAPASKCSQGASRLSGVKKQIPYVEAFRFPSIVLERTVARVNIRGETPRHLERPPATIPRQLARTVCYAVLTKIEIWPLSPSKKAEEFTWGFQSAVLGPG